MEVWLEESIDVMPCMGLPPVQCTVSGLNGFRTQADSLRVEVHGEDGSEDLAVYDWNGVGSFTHDVPLPLATVHGDLRIDVEAMKDGDSVDRFQGNRPSFGQEELVLGLRTTQDSMYARTLPGSRLVGCEDMVESLGKDRMDRLRRPSNPGSDTVWEFMDLLLEYLSGFRTVGPRIPSSGRFGIGTITDLVETREGTSACQGLLFYKMAKELGFSPVVAFSHGRCFAGVGALNDTSLETRRLMCMVTARSSGSVPFVSFGSYLMAEVGTRLSTEDAVRSALEHHRSAGFGGDIVCDSIQIRKVERLESRNL